MAPAYKNPEHFGVVVGINRYPDKGRGSLGHLRYARDDALEFYEWLIDPEGGSVPPGNCERIVVEDERVPDDCPPGQATPKCDEIDWLIDAVGKRADARFRNEDGEFDEAAWNRSRLYYYVSGHGLGKGTNDAWLLAANAGPTHGWGWHVSSDRVLQYYAQLQTFREVVILADCCRDEKDVTVRALSCERGERRNRGGVWFTIGFGARPGQKSYESTGVNEHKGYFTEALLKGLKGEAAPPGVEINCVNLGTFIGIYLEDRTKKRQQADFRPSSTRPIVFRPGLPAPVPQQGLPTPPPVPYKASLHFGGFAGLVQLIGGGDLRPIGAPQVIAPGGAWVVCLPTGMYEVESVPPGAVFAHEGRFKVVGGDCRVDF